MTKKSLHSVIYTGLLVLINIAFIRFYVGNGFDLTIYDSLMLNIDLCVYIINITLRYVTCK